MVRARKDAQLGVRVTVETPHFSCLLKKAGEGQRMLLGFRLEAGGFPLRGISVSSRSSILDSHHFSPCFAAV